MGNFINLVGQRYGRLTVVSQGENRKLKVTWNCACDCGGTITVVAGSLKRGVTKSCGCLHKETARVNGAIMRKHGLTHSWEYNVWLGMKTRCYRQDAHSYSRYGGRGIKVCERWIHSFENFLADMGPRPNPKATIDRIDNDGNYAPGNCRWASPNQQASNRSDTRFITHDGITMSLSEWARQKHMIPETLARRLKHGWTVEKALETPIQVNKSHHCPKRRSIPSLRAATE